MKNIKRTIDDCLRASDFRDLMISNCSSVSRSSGSSLRILSLLLLFILTLRRRYTRIMELGGLESLTLVELQRSESQWGVTLSSPVTFSRPLHPPTPQSSTSDFKAEVCLPLLVSVGRLITIGHICIRVSRAKAFRCLEAHWGRCLDSSSPLTLFRSLRQSLCCSKSHWYSRLCHEGLSLYARPLNE